MASLIIGASVYLHQKVKNKKDAKKEAKAKGYEKRYQELEDEHKKMQPEQNIQSEKGRASLTQSTDGTRSDGHRRMSEESSRSEEDGPGRWVSEANIEKARA